MWTQSKYDTVNFIFILEFGDLLQMKQPPFFFWPWDAGAGQSQGLHDAITWKKLC